MPDFDYNKHVDCPTGKLIYSTIREAVDRGECLTIIGPPGCGKSMAVKFAVSIDCNLRYVTATPASAGMKAFLWQVHGAFGVDSMRHSISGLQDNLWVALREIRREASVALIVDEAQNLDLKTLRTALFLHDEAGLLVILVGNSSVLKKTKTKDAAFDQLADRQGEPLRIPGITRGDIEAFGVLHNVEGVDAYALLVRYGLEEQSFRGVMRLLKSARSLAGSAGSIRHSHLKSALARMLGPAASKRLIKPKDQKVLTAQPDCARRETETCG
ncbi:MAG: ATP-binding protein [Rhodobacteraceae bacterium]|nr:ATP-binding protein [Paracoccaceae bacterium]